MSENIVTSLKTNEISLTLSMVIKIHAQAVSMNKNFSELDPRYALTYDTYDLTTWAYYKNIAGEPHYFNSDAIIITSIDTGEDIDITIPGTLDKHKLTRQTLLQFGQEFIDLVSKYPRDIMYIKGLLRPIPTNVSIAAEDGDILSYTENLVANNEVSLIVSLQHSIKAYISRWFLENYILTDDLFSSFFNATLTAFLILRIKNHRKSMIGTFEVSEEDMMNMFNSNLNIGQYTKNLPWKTKLWLYKHLKYLMSYSGNDEVIDILHKNLVVPSGMEIEEVILYPTEKEYVNRPEKDGPTYIPISEQAYLRNMSTGALMHTSIADVVSLQNMNLIEAQNDPSIIDTAISEAQVPVPIADESKVLMFKRLLKDIDVMENRTICLVESTLYYFIRNIDSGEVFNIKIPSSSLSVTFTVEDVVKYMLFLLSKLVNVNLPELTTWRFTAVRDMTQPLYSDSMSHEYYNGDDPFEGMYDEFINLPVTTDAPVKDFMDYQMALNEKTYLLKAIEHNYLIKSFHNVMLENTKVEPLDITIDMRDGVEEYIRNKTLLPNDADYVIELDNLIYTITGYRLLEDSLSNMLLEDIINILKRILSYTVQLVNLEEGEDVTIRQYGFGPLYGINISEIKSMCIDALGAWSEIPFAAGNDARGYVDVYYDSLLEVEDMKYDYEPEIRAYPFNGVGVFRDGVLNVS